MNSIRLIAAAALACAGFSGAALAKLQIIDPPSAAKAALEASADAATAVAERGAMRARAATPNWEALKSLATLLREHPETAQEIEVPVFEDVTLSLVIDQVEVTGDDTTAFYGYVAGQPLRSAVILEHKGKFAMHVGLEDKAYQVTWRGSSHQAMEIDRAEFSLRGDEDPQHRHAPTLESDSSKAQREPAAAAAADDGAIVDVMILYSPTARTSAGGTTAIQNQIALAIASTNQAYAASGVVQRLRLVHTQEINYTEARNLDTTLTQLTDNSAPFQGVEALRTQYGADVVSMWVEEGGPYCGIAWVMDTISSSFARYAYNVEARTCATTGGTLAHEMGHNMGLEHDLYVSPEGPNHPVAQRYAHGFVNLAGRFYTIMAYPNLCIDSGVGCSRINQFSDPTNVVNGTPTGNATTADASRMLDFTRVTVANFRASVTTTPPPPSPVVALAQSSYSVSEGASSVSVVVNRTGSTTGISTVAWTTANGSAVAGSDFGTAGSASQRSGTLSFAAGQTSKTITVPIINDTAVESSESFTVKLSSPTGATLGLATATVTVADNDTVTPPPPPPPPPAGGALQFSAATASVAENARTLRLTVNRSGSINLAASVRWATSNGSAVAGQDFGTRGRATPLAGTVSWRAFDGAAKTITIPIIDDAAAESAKTFTVTLSNPSSSMTLGSPSTVTVTVTDNESGGGGGGGGGTESTELRFGLSRYAVSEAAGSVVLTVNRVNLGGGFGAAASASYSTQASTALSGSDFVATSGTVSWAAGDSAPKTITIPIVASAAVESSEVFNVTLSGPSAGTRIGTASTQVYVMDGNRTR
jgi:hypothetical protein